MGSIVIDVMLKSEILDPQGQAVRGALPRLGFSGFTDVRQGKRFVLTVDGDVTDEHLAAARDAAERLLSNPVIEDVVSVRAEDGQTPREHTEEPAEGADPDAAEDGDAPREHTEEPAEGPDTEETTGEGEPAEGDEQSEGDESDEDEGEQ